MRFLESVYKIEWEEVLLCRVSIVLPVYNRRHCIARAVDSIMEQTFPEYELIIVDDNSADGTGEYIKSLPYRRIKFIPLYIPAWMCLWRKRAVTFLKIYWNIR